MMASSSQLISPKPHTLKFDTTAIHAVGGQLKGASTVIARVSSRIPSGVNSRGSSKFSLRLPDVLPLAETGSGEDLITKTKR